LIRGATVFDGEGGRMDRGDVLIADGVIKAVETNLMTPDGAVVIDGTGKFVTPGIIDVHSHLGDYPSPGVESMSDGNEATSPARPEVWAEHSVWPQDPGFSRALVNGGVTAMQILPGSANLFGGRSVVVKNVPARTVQGMKFPGAPYGLKMACGENPKRVYGSKGNMPQTRMGNIALTRQTWIKAVEYKRKWDKYAKEGGDIPDRDLAMDTLKGVLEGKILVHNHCYRADEMAIMIDMAKEFGYHVTAFHHAVEAYKIADLLRDGPRGVAELAAAAGAHEGALYRLLRALAGATGTASRWKATMRSTRTSRWFTMPGPARSSTPTMPTTSSG